ncbi:MAG: tRNA (adenosine(37)-N6)-dimethylallyltransferase MiaA, partial [Omnitrophica bacterium GWA2_52_8]
LCAVKDITKRGRLPIVVGGTGFYVRTLLYGLAPVLPGTNAVRKKLEHEAAQKGTGVLYDRLGMLDPERAAKIQKNDRQRILRALEILALTGEKPSELYRRHEHKFMAGFSPVLIGIRRNRADLYERINQRVDRMFKRGWMAETKKIMRKKVSHTAAQALGYREIHEVILGESDSRSARDVIKKKTRHFAKRQMTWFRKEQDVRWFDWAEGESVGAMSVQVAHWFRTTGLHGAK